MPTPKSFFKIVFLFIISYSLLTAAEGADNILRNGSFSTIKQDSKIPGEWSKGWPANQGQWKLDDKIFNSAPYSISIKNTDPDQDSIYTQAFPVKPDTRYKLSFWMKGDNILSGNGKSGAVALIESTDGQKLIITGSGKGEWRSTDGSFDWQKVELFFNSANNEQLKISIALLKSSGTAWFDDITIVPFRQSTATVSSEVFPLDFQKGIYSLAGDLPGILTFRFKGDKKNLAGLKLSIDLPEGCELIGAASWFPGEKDSSGYYKYSPDPVSAAPVPADSKNYTRYTVSLSPSFIDRTALASYTWMNQERLYIKKQTPVKNYQKAEAKWFLTSGKWKSEEKKFELHFLPQIRKPESPANEFGLMVCYLESVTDPFPEIRKRYFDYWGALSRKANTMNVFGWNSIKPDSKKEVAEIFRTNLVIGSIFETPLPNVGQWEKKVSSGKIPRAVLENGKENPAAACPSYLEQEPLEAPVWKCIGNSVKDLMKFIDGKKIVYDIEPGSSTHCFCPVCLEKFRKFISPGNFKNIAEIKQKYSSQWFAFRVRQNNLIIENFSKVVKKEFPESEFWICSDPIHSEGRELSEWCGVDVRLADKYVDGHMNMPYYSGETFYNDMALNLKVLKKPNFPLIDPSENDERFFSRYTPGSVAQNIIAAAVLGCKGIGFWPYDIFDGAYLTAINNAYAAVGQAEKYYMNGSPETNSGISPQNVNRKEFDDEGRKISAVFPDFAKTLKSHMHRKDGNLLATMINYNTNWSAIARITPDNISAGNYEVREIDTGKIHISKAGKRFFTSSELMTDGVLAEVPSGTYRIIEIRKESGNPKDIENGNAVFQEKLAEKLSSETERIAKTCQFLEKQDQNKQLAIGWGDPDRNNIPELKISSPEKAVYISPEKGAGITFWRERKSGENDDYVTSSGNAGLLGNPILYGDVTGTGGYPFLLKKADISENGIPYVEFFNKFSGGLNANPEADPLSGVEITKGIYFENNGTDLKLVFTLKNMSLSGKTIKTGFRIKNMSFIGACLSGKNPPVQITKIKTVLNGKQSIISENLNPNNIFLLEESRDLDFAKQLNVKPRPWELSDIIVEAEAEGHQRMLSITLDMKNTAGFYIWWSLNSGFTVELLSKEFEIPYGQEVTYECSFHVKKI